MIIDDEYLIFFTHIVICINMQQFTIKNMICKGVDIFTKRLSYK